MQETLGFFPIKSNVLGFGDEIMMQYDKDNMRLKISVFEGNHYKDECEIKLDTLLNTIFLPF